jgi:hypothetical protein
MATKIPAYISPEQNNSLKICKIMDETIKIYSCLYLEKIMAEVQN